MRDLSEEERRKQSEQLGTESRQVYQQLSDLRRQDRQLQLRQLASQIGYQDAKDVAAFVDTVQRIYRETDSGSGRFFGRRGGGGQQQ
jgi:cytochrome c553